MKSPAAGEPGPRIQGQSSRRGGRQGGALSLASFAGAKASTYDKRVVVARQRHLKAKQLRRYNKLLASDGGEGAAPGGGAVEASYDPYEDVYQGDAADAHPGGPLPQPPPGAPLAQPAKRQRKKFNALQVLAQQKAAEREEALRAAAEAQALAAQRRAQQQAAQQARKAASEGMRKRNSKGQPIMKYRVNNILAKLQHEALQKQAR